MDIELRLREALQLDDPGERFTDGVMSRLGDTVPDTLLPRGVPSLGAARARRRRGLMLIAGALAALAAAAMLVMWQAKPPAPALAVDSLVPAEPTPAPAINSVQGDAQVHAASAPLAEPTGNELPSVAGPADDNAPRLLIKALSLRSADPAARPAAESFYQALRQQLHGFDDVVVMDEDATTRRPSSDIDYRVSVTSLNASIPPPGRVAAGTGDVEADGGEPVSSTDRWPIEVKIETLKFESPRAGPDFFAVRFDVDRSGVPFFKSCIAHFRTGSSSPVNSHGMAAARQLLTGCAADRISAALAQLVRPDVVANKVDSVDPQQVLRQVLDTSLPEARRGNALMQLLNLQREGAVTLDAEAAKGIVAYVRERPADQQERWWLIIGGVNAPTLVDPLSDVLREHPDEPTRLMLTAMLALTHAGNPDVRKALDLLSRDDASELVRMAARRETIDDAAWNDYVVRTLVDVSLSGQQRMSPLLHSVRFASTASRRADLRAILAVDANVLALADVIDGSRADAAHGEKVAQLLSAANAHATHPALLELQLRILNDTSRPASGPLASAAVRGLTEHRDDPRVREVFERLLAGGGDTNMRHEIERALNLSGP